MKILSRKAIEKEIQATQKKLSKLRWSSDSSEQRAYQMSYLKERLSVLREDLKFFSYE